MFSCRRRIKAAGELLKTCICLPREALIVWDGHHQERNRQLAISPPNFEGDRARTGHISRTSRNEMSHSNSKQVLPASSQGPEGGADHCVSDTPTVGAKTPQQKAIGNDGQVGVKRAHTDMPYYLATATPQPMSTVHVSGHTCWRPLLVPAESKASEKKGAPAGCRRTASRTPPPSIAPADLSVKQLHSCETSGDTSDEQATLTTFLRLIEMRATILGY